MPSSDSSASVTARPKRIRLGDLLLENNLITQEQLEKALAGQKKSGRKLGRELIESGYITEAQLADLLSRQLNIPFVDLKQVRVDAATVRLVPETYCRRYRVLAIENRADGVTVGMVDPTDIFAYDELVRLLNRPIRLAVIKEEDLNQSLDRTFRRQTELHDLASELGQGLTSKADEAPVQSLAGGEGEAPVVKFLQTIFEDAVQAGASDIHIEPDERELRIRLRQDGVLNVQARMDLKAAAPLVSRLKLMAGLDISEKRLPQDGRFNVKIRDKSVDVRLSTVPVQYGEAAVMRLLNQSAGIIGLSKIGMPEHILERFRRAIHSPNGMVLVTGPTGSGKTTTLYGAIHELNEPDVKILTAEDPVEYRLPGINQVQVNAKIDLTFARVLRTFLRQDPDIILVGEMRDEETVEIGLRAAITGHFVLSSLHTNDAVATAMRLVDMGAEPYLIAAALRGVMAQRLVRRVCEGCAEPYALSDREKALVASHLTDPAAPATYRRGKGCSQCNGSGYHGRAGIYEWLEMDSDLIRLLQDSDLRGFEETARKKPSFQNLKRSALNLAAEGVTSIDQVIQVTFGVND